MVEAAERRRKFFEMLRMELRANEQRRAAIDEAISKLKSVEQEITGSLANLDDERKERENLKERRGSERGGLVERKTHLERELSELEGKLRELEQAEELHRAEMEGLHKKEEGILERAEAKIQQMEVGDAEARAQHAEHLEAQELRRRFGRE